MTNVLPASVASLRFSNATVYTYEAEQSLYSRTCPGVFMELAGPSSIAHLNASEFSVDLQGFGPRDVFMCATVREYLEMNGSNGRTLSTLGRQGVYWYFINEVSDEQVSLLPESLAAADPLDTMTDRLKDILYDMPDARVEQFGYGLVKTLIRAEREEAQKAS